MADLKILKLIDRKAEYERELEELQSEYENIPAEIQKQIDTLNACKIKLYRNGKPLDWREAIDMCLDGKPYSSKASNKMYELKKALDKKIEAKYYNRDILPESCFNNGDREDFSDEYRKVLSGIMKEQSSIFNAILKIDNLYYSLTNIPADVTQITKKIEKQNDKIANLRSISKDLPKALVDLKNMYTNLFFKSYKESRNAIEQLKEKYTIDDEFYAEMKKRKISSNVLRFAGKTDAQLKEAAEDEANILVINLYERCSVYTGNVLEVKYANIANNGEINGIVIGESGSAEIRTIVAGGYNIQCLHYRVLVIPR